MPHTSLLTPRAAALARQLEFFARTRVEGYLKSVNRSRRKGQSTDFLQHREYLPGDDLRKLDWRVFARSDRLVTREYEETTNLDVILGMDVSGSMEYAGEGLSKLEFSRRCAAMLSYLLFSQRDSFGLAELTDQVRQFVRPGNGRRHFSRICQQLASLSAGGETNFEACSHQLLRQVRRRSVFVFFSDGYQEPEALTRALGALALQHHDVLLYQIFDPAERELPFAGFTLFRDLESGALDAADPLEIQAAYREIFDDHVARLRKGSLGAGIEFHSVPVSEEWDRALSQLLRERTRRK